MARSHCSGALQALYHVFVHPALPRSLSSRPHFRHSLPALQHARPFAHTSCRYVQSRAPEPRAQKWNEEISARLIYLVDEHTNKRADEPVTRYDILNTLNRETHRLVQLTPDEPGNPHLIPTCRVISKKEQYEADRSRKREEKERKAESGRANSVKTLELNWAIDANDLGHRLERVAEFLAEGRRVEIVLAAKKKGRGRRATEEECRGVLKRIRDTVDSVRGARELKELEGKVGGLASMVLQGSMLSKMKADSGSEQQK